MSTHGTSRVSFNSILVRLKGSDTRCANHSYLLFQFHTGSIKSRRKPDTYHEGSWISFNSILVRLKDSVTTVLAIYTRWTVFNSILVRLKDR